MTGTLTLSPDSSYGYYGVYVDALQRRFPAARIRFANHDLPQLRSPRSGLAAVTPDGRRLFLAADDHAVVDEVALRWCDAYGAANITPSAAGLGDRMVALGPSFGARVGGFWHAASFVARASMAGGYRLAGPASRLRAALRHNRHRLPLSSYAASRSDASRLFMLSSHWPQYPDVNESRRRIVNELRQLPNLTFVGGLVGDPTPFIGAQHMPLGRYLDELGRSVAAINTPAVHGCLGWKLGEYFAMGKAIVSLPLNRVLPGDPEPGELYLEVADAAETVEAIRRLRVDTALRRGLESRSRHYFDTVVSPAAAISRVLAAAGN